MTLPTFARRSDELEIMDDPSIQGPELERTLYEIEFINRVLGGYGPSLDPLATLAPDCGRPMTVLDVGTGSADVPMKMVDWGNSNGRSVEVTGIELTDTTVDYARRRSASYPAVRIEKSDLFEMDSKRTFDVVHAAAVLHHFPGDAAIRALGAMYRHARVAVVINDFHRHPLAWGGIRILTAAFSKSRLVRNDGPLSVLRAFTRQELFAMCRAAEIPPPQIRWRPMFRWEAVIRRP